MQNSWMRAVMFSSLQQVTAKTIIRQTREETTFSHIGQVQWSHRVIPRTCRRNLVSGTWSTSSRRDWQLFLTDWIQVSGCSTHRRCPLDGDCRNRIQTQLPGRGPCSPMHGWQQPLSWHSSPDEHQIHVSTATLNIKRKQNIMHSARK